MLPPAPARFSTSTCWPTLSARNLATMRATVSVPPPGSKPTTMVIGLDGKLLCADATPTTNMARKTTATRCSIVIPPRSTPVEHGLALLHEGLAALLVVLALHAGLDQRPAELRIRRGLAHFADDALRRLHGQRRIGRDGIAIFLHHGFQVFLCRDLLDQTHFLRFGRRELPGREHDLA